jgi:hypothetical protein
LSAGEKAIKHQIKTISISSCLRHTVSFKA